MYVVRDMIYRPGRIPQIWPEEGEERFKYYPSNCGVLVRTRVRWVDNWWLEVHGCWHD